MARPTKGDSEKLSAVLPVRCTETDKEIIRNRSKEVGMSSSQFLRELGTKGDIQMRQSQYDFETVQQLRKLGININQQTKKLHATGFASKELKALWQKLDTVLTDMMENK